MARKSVMAVWAKWRRGKRASTMIEDIMNELMNVIVVYFAYDCVASQVYSPVCSVGVLKCKYPVL